MTSEKLQKLIHECIQEVLNESCAACSETAEQCPECALEEDSEQALVPFQKIAQSTNNVEDFMKMFVGKKLKNLLDATSFANLYVMNKYPIGGGVDDTDVQVLLRNLMIAATAFINHRGLEPIGKKRDAWDKEHYSKPEYIEWNKKRAAALKSYLNARKTGDESAIKKATKEKDDIMSADPTLWDYRKMMSDRDTVVKQWHDTPLTLKDVLPSPDDSEESKKNWGYVEKAFDAFKRVYSKEEPEQFREWLKVSKKDPAVQLVLKEYVSHKDKHKANKILLKLYKNKP